MNEREIFTWWFFSVSFMILGILFLAEKEPSLIILNLFVAPFSIISYFIFDLFRNEIKEKNEK
jgi:hypothetical protein